MMISFPPLLLRTYFECNKGKNKTTFFSQGVEEVKKKRGFWARETLVTICRDDWMGFAQDFSRQSFETIAGNIKDVILDFL